MLQLPRRVDGEYARDWDANSAVGIRIIRLVSIAGKEWILPLKQVLDILEAADLELLWIFVDHLSLEGVEERVRVEENRPFWEAEHVL